MITFLLKKLATLIPTLLGVTVVAFALIRLIPGDPIEIMVGERRLDAAAHAALMADGNFGGLALGIREQECEWEVEDADAVAVALPARYRITYRTLANDLSTLG